MFNFENLKALLQDTILVHRLTELLHLYGSEYIDKTLLNLFLGDLFSSSEKLTSVVSLISYWTLETPYENNELKKVMTALAILANCAPASSYDIKQEDLDFANNQVEKYKNNESLIE